ncbi:hypothetical protein AEAC466_04545 [Asticcacaulis sp. AC466]|uniref:VapE domain-containing protein n=1 Tax=Asticcacaulis sp. AC466 TaxID=1282362 RepID=UPI0003C3BB4D|nr:VapE domain-containing protein [Asticcacaulis sp. AC466]ESQ85438.1 hypothetical protein AEAC466_04545 [Asticcacaulis sp. AC466]
MNGERNEDRMLSAAKPLIAAGLAIHWLRPKTKAPYKGWAAAPVHTWQTAKEAYRRGQNIGIRTGEPSKTRWGYLHLIDMDIRDADQADAAWQVILDLWPDARQAPYVISGSGGESRHLYFFTDKPFYKLTLGKSFGFTQVWSEEKHRNVKKYDWEVVLYGTNVQAVLPPSIHPDTGLEYRWGREIDFEALDLGMGPLLDSDDVAAWGALDNDLNEDDDDDDLNGLIKQRPMDLSDDEIDSIMEDLPSDWVDDRDQWYQVGMALHHQYEGGALGFERWSEWSKGSEKYDPRDQARVWKSFKGAKRPLRMALLIKASKENRIDRQFGDVDLLDGDEDDDLADLLCADVGNKALVPYQEKASPTDILLDDLEDLLIASVPPPPIKVERARIAPDPDWKTYFQLTDDGLKASLHNVELIVRYDKRIRNVIGFNEFSQQIVRIELAGRLKEARVGAKKPRRQLDDGFWTLRDEVKGDRWGDEHLAALRAMIEAPDSQGGYSLKVSDRDLKAAVLMVSRKRSFHPVKEYFDSLRWDGKPRLDRMFIDHLGAEDNAYHRQIARMTLVSAVTRIFEPGHKFDFVPILEGAQGKGKSTFIRILARDWYTELEGDFSDRKTMVEKMEGSMICELPELQGFSKHEVTTIKGFVSAATDRMRRPFASYAEDVPRQCIFMGTTNEGEYLRDPTGGRRFWPVFCTVEEIDFKRLQRDLDQLWAEAVYLYRNMRKTQPVGTLPLYLTEADARVEALAIQESRRQDTPEEMLAGQIEGWLNTPIAADFDDADDAEPRYRDVVCVLDVWVDMAGRDMASLDPRNSQLYARALRSVPGWRAAGRDATARFGRQRVFRRDV